MNTEDKCNDKHRAIMPCYWLDKTTEFSTSGKEKKILI